MTRETWSKVTADGPDWFVALVRQALDECDNTPAPIETLIAKPYTVELHTQAEFRSASYMVPSGAGEIPAEGHVVGRNRLWINARIAKRKPKKARHIVRHELAHVLPLTAAKKRDLMALMEDENGQHPTSWKKAGYRKRPSECFADTLAEAMSGIDSPWDDFVYYRLDVADEDVRKFVDITFRANPAPVDEDDDEPVSLPPTSELEALNAAIATLQAERTQLLDMRAADAKAAADIKALADQIITRSGGNP